MRQRTHKQIGAVSLFIVIFSALLITIATVSFVGLMIKDQQQATEVDLSQSAYDSALAGVEDAKRAILKYKTICSTGTADECSAAKALLLRSECNASVGTLSDVVPNEKNEVDIKTGDSNKLNQSYTCVKIKLDTANYLGKLLADTYDMIPLSGVTNDFDSVKLEWFSSNNLSPDETSVDLISASDLWLFKNWPQKQNRPAVVHAQLIQYGENGFTLSDLDKNALDMSNNNSLFLYPTRQAAPASVGFVANDSRRDSVNKPVPVKCFDTLSSGGYACSITLKLPKPIGNPVDDVSRKEAYLRLGMLYNTSNYRVSLMKEGEPEPINFNGVQPEIDSNGRTSDLFRRVKARVRVADITFPYPTAALRVDGNLCKNFVITDDENDYRSSCTP